MREMSLRAGMVERFGRSWAAVGGFIILFAALLFIVSAVLDNKRVLDFVPFGMFLMFSGIVAIVSVFLRGSIRGILLFVIPAVFMAVFVIIMGDMVLYYLNPMFDLPDSFFLLILGVTLCVLAVYVIGTIVIFGPFAALAARRYFPLSRFAIRFSRIFAVIWAVGFIVYCIAVLLFYFDAIRQYTGYYGISPGGGKFCVTMIFLSAIPAFGTAFIAGTNWSDNPPAIASILARRGIITGFACLGMYYITGVVCIFAASRMRPDEIFPLNLLLVLAVGFTILIALGVSHIVLLLTHKYWKRRVHVEIKRLGREINAGKD